MSRRLALAWNAVSLAAPAAVGTVTGNRLPVRKIVDVEFAGSGERLLALAEGQPEQLRRFRSVLGSNDNYYAAWYGIGLLLAHRTLPTCARGFGAAFTAGACAADVVENGGLEHALTHLLENPDDAPAADAAARRAMVAAAVKFTLLLPAVVLSVAGLLRGR